MIANIIRSRQKTALGGGGGGGIVTDNGDPFYSAVSLLLPMDGINGSTTFTDSGPNALAVTATGDSQVSTTTAKYGGASGYFGSTTGSISFPSSAIALGTNDFTIECWVYPLSWGTSPNQPVIVGSGNNGIVFYLSNTGKLWVGQYGVVNFANSTASVPLNSWTHVAVSRSGTSVKLFINGVIDGSGSTSTSLNASVTPQIGVDPSNSAQKFYGFIDDLRISKYARYTSAFTPPTAALPTTASSTPADPYYGYTSLLLHMDGSNASTAFVDSGPNAFTLTRYGTAAISTTQSKFGGASAYFDGSGARLGLSSTAIDFGTGDFTAECWLYIISTPTGAYAQVMGKQVGGVSASWLLYLNTSRILLFGWNNTVQLIQSPSALNLSQWYHVAVARSGSTIRMFIDGAQVASTAISYTFASSTEFTVGSSSNDFASARLNAYIDDIRITKYARYTSAFAPPAQAHLEYANGNDRYFSNVSLLLHMDGANGSTTFTDNSSNALAITRTGTAAISTAQSQFGGASAYFDGSTGYLSLTGNSSFQFGTGDFTIEAWVYISANAANQQTFLDTRGTATATPFTFGIYQSKLAFYDGTMRQSSATITTGQWYHFAACRSSGTLRLFIDGISYYSASSTTNFTTGANSIYIGRGFDAAAYYTNGFIDDIRISKFARYSANFTPPTSAHPNA